ncbi:MAG: DNA-binding CsgD family transcriptional regulator [Aureispira sp.]|jgi:DNA-binding CsgD family transcriptional regulator
MNKIQALFQEYAQLLNQQDFVGNELDYNIFEAQKPFLDKMVQINNTALTVFDLYQQKHIYNSYNLSELFGYDLDNIDTDYYNSRIHPDDLYLLTRTGVLALKYSYQIPIEERKNFKLQNEYRVLNAKNQYIRVVEQFQTLELDAKGNYWLALTLLDISPNQEVYNGIRSQLINLKDGSTQVIKHNFKRDTVLSNRESQVLSFIKSGLLSKEISDKLSISLHTVNTHRQNILKKLGANNSLEAIQYANKLNII